GVEKTRKFLISDMDGKRLGWVVEDPKGHFGKTMLRQFLGAHRPFKATLQDIKGNILLHMARPYTWFNSEIHVLNAQGDRLGYIERRCHAWKRRYNLYLGDEMFAKVREGVLSWDFSLKGKDGHFMGHISRRFRGALREAFTDTGKYIMEMESIKDIHSSQLYPMTISERALMLAMLICIDFDFFSPWSNPYG
ncbi:Scramblase, partial [Piptocephalis cylindrospora]